MMGAKAGQWGCIHYSQPQVMMSEGERERGEEGRGKGVIQSASKYEDKRFVRALPFLALI